MKLWRFLPRNRSLFFRWLLSYISILLIPVIISGFVSVFSEKVLQDETNRANAAMLKQVQQTIDEMTVSFGKTAAQISINQSLRSVLSISGSYDGVGQFNIYTLMKQLNKYVPTNEYISDIYIYFKNTDSVLSDESRADTRYFIENYFPGSSMSYEQLMKLLNGRHMMDYYVIDSKMSSGKNSKDIIFLQSLPLINSGNYTGTLIGVIPEEKFQKVINNLKWVEQSEFIIIDQNGGELLSNGPRTLPFGTILEAVEGNKNKEYKGIKGGRYVIAGITSDVTR